MSVICVLLFAVPASPATGHGAPLGDGVRDDRPEREVERLQGPPHRRREHALEQALLRQEGRRPGRRLKEGGGCKVSQLSMYRVTQQVADLGWVDLDLGCSTILLGQ